MNRTLFNPSHRAFDPSRSDLTREEVKTLRRQAGSAATWFFAIWCAATAPFLIMTWPHAAAHLLAGELSPTLAMAFFLSINWIIFAFGVVFGVWRKPAKLRDAMLGLRRCPSCAYRLDASTTEPDGCTVCPECGAAWRMSETSASAP